MKKPEITKYYVARNKNGSVFLYNKKAYQIEGTRLLENWRQTFGDNLMLLLKGALYARTR